MAHLNNEATPSSAKAPSDVTGPKIYPVTMEMMEEEDDRLTQFLKSLEKRIAEDKAAQNKE